MASATLIKRFAKRERRIGSGVEEGILCLRFELAVRSKLGYLPAEAGGGVSRSHAMLLEASFRQSKRVER